jgi:hypothetical protein
MYSIPEDFKTFSELSREELFARCPGLVFDKEDSGILYFTANVSEAFVKLIDETWYLEKYRNEGTGATGYYRDGTKVRFDRRVRDWEFSNNLVGVFTIVHMPRR